MNEQELNEIKARAEKATKGPWSLDSHYLVGYPPDARPTGETFLHLLPTYRSGAHSADLANADFIAHAREDIPRLIAEVERLGNLEGVKSDAYEMHRVAGDYWSRLQASLKEITRLQEALVEERAEKIHAWGCTDWGTSDWEIYPIVKKDEMRASAREELKKEHPEWFQ